MRLHSFHVILVSRFLTKNASYGGDVCSSVSDLVSAPNIITDAKHVLRHPVPCVDICTEEKSFVLNEKPVMMTSIPILLSRIGMCLLERVLDWMFGFIALIYTTRNYTLQITDTHRLVFSVYYSLH
jgi:hypothetical protein